MNKDFKIKLKLFIINNFLPILTKNIITRKLIFFIFNSSILKILIKIFPPSRNQGIDNIIQNQEDLFINNYFDNCGYITFMDIGSYPGGNILLRAQKGWNGYLFEPDIINYLFLKYQFTAHNNIKLFNLAITGSEATNCKLYISHTHQDIHSLKPWHETHRSSYNINSTDIYRFCNKKNIKKLDFLRIDLDGDILAIIKNINFKEIKPNILMIKFADKKSKPFFNYAYQDIINYMSQFHYISYIFSYEKERPFMKNDKTYDVLKYNQICPAGKEDKLKMFEGNIIFYKKDDDNFNSLVNTYINTNRNTYINAHEYFRDIHKNERCFVICNGPSLKEMDLTKMQKEITFGCNRIYFNTEKMGFDTTYYFSLDSFISIAIRHESLKYLERPAVKAGFFLNHFSKYIKKDNAYYLEQTGWSVGVTMMEMALAMGFKYIYVIGLDLNYNFPDKKDRIDYNRIEDLPFDKETMNILLDLKDYIDIKNRFILKKNIDINSNHFSKDYLNNLPVCLATEPEAIAAYKNFAKNLSESDRSRIYNAGVGGNCEAFQRVDFNGLF
ncbi:MAG: 6-hydroxymethylpterin diphosphokinase MptE-like protein [Pseudomonadota bacterium]